jgi:ribosomal protein L11 methyltransferase
MVVLRLECSADDKDRLIAELWQLGTSGIIEHDLPGARWHLEAFFEAPFDASGFVAFAPRWSAAEERDWIAEAQSQWQPVLVGSRFFLAPSWCSDPAPPGRLRLEMQPGQACGTGWHPATQVALEALDRWLDPGATVLDLGTGSGILSVAASLLGAGRILACDIDPAAALVARDRLRTEGIPTRVFAGSVRSIGSGQLDLVVANINAPTLVSLAPEIRRALKPGGRVLLSGFAVRQLDRVREAFGPERDQLRRGHWVALVCENA